MGILVEGIQKKIFPAVTVALPGDTSLFSSIG